MIRTEKLLTLPEVVRRTGLGYKVVLRLIERDFYTGAVRVGRNRFVPIEDLAKLRAAARTAGYEK